MFHTTVKCVDCGTVMVDVPGNTKRCAVCRVGHNRESVRKANEAERARLAAEAAQPKPRNLDDDLEALKKYNKQRRAAGFELWRLEVQRGPGGIRMKEFDSIRIVDKGESISFEMTGDVAGNPHEAIMFLFRAASGLIAAVTKEDADPQEAAEAFGKVFTKHVAQDIQDERGRRAEEKAGEKEAEEHEQKRENEPQAVY